MLVLQVPPISIIHEKKTGQTLYKALSLHIYDRGNIYLDRDIEKLGRFDNFPEETACKSWFFRMSTGAKLNWSFNNRL